MILPGKLSHTQIMIWLESEDTGHLTQPAPLDTRVFTFDKWQPVGNSKIVQIVNISCFDIKILLSNTLENNYKSILNKLNNKN